MNTFCPELLSELNQQKIKEEMAVIRLEQSVLGRPIHLKWLDRGLITLGNWMVACGERLRRHYIESVSQAGSPSLLMDAAKKYGA